MSLKENQVLIIVDWAMKYLPQTFRETQSEWFGKQGISWHISCALCLKESDDQNEPEQALEIFSFVHLLNRGNQGWFSVSQILLDTFTQLKEKRPRLSEVFIKSDNAGCYHSLQLLAFLWKCQAENKLPLKILEYNFSEVQSGKDICDSRTGTCRLHMCNYTNEGHDITNVFQMKDALDSHNGIRNTYTSVIDIATDKQPSLCGSIKNLQISFYNNFVFQADGIQIFKAYKVSSGILIENRDLERIAKNLVVTDGFQVNFIHVMTSKCSMQDI